MNSIIAQAKPYMDYIAVGLIWLVIGLYMLLQRKGKQPSGEAFEVDPELTRQSKGRLSSLDAMAGLDSRDKNSIDLFETVPQRNSPFPDVVQHNSPFPEASNLQKSPSSEPLPFKSIGDKGIAGSSPLHFEDPMSGSAVAEEIYKAAPEEETDRSALLTQYTSGDGGGVEEMERMLKVDPDNLQLLDWLAFMYYSNDQVEKAIESYSRIIRLEPGNASQHYYLGNCYCKQGSLDKAREQWEEVQRLKPGSKYAQKAGKRILQL